jgi:hypothetical protein
VELYRHPRRCLYGVYRDKFFGFWLLRDINETCALLGYYAAFSGSYVPTFRDNLSLESSKVKRCLDFLTLEDGKDTFSEMSVKAYNL